MRISNLSSQHLFSGSTAHDIGQAAERANTEWLHDLSESILLRSDTNQLIADMIEKWAFDVPRLNADDVSTDHREEQVSLSSLTGWDTAATFGGGTPRKMHIVEFHVPFEGNRNIFSYSPSSRMLSGPHAAVMASDLVIRIPSEGKKADQIKAEFVATLDSINQCLATLRTDFAAAIKSMEGSARLIVEDRKAKLMQQANVVADLGFPMKRRADAPNTYRAPEVRRKIAPVPTKAVVGKAQRPEPILDENEYQHILNVMDNMTKVMERSPASAALAAS